MSAAASQRLAVVWTGACQVLWALCLVVLWGAACDGSGTGAVRTGAAALAAVALASGWPARAAWAIRRVLAWRRGQAAAVAPAPAGSWWVGGGDVRTMGRLLAVTAVLTAVGGLLSTAGVFLGGRLMGAMGSWMAWDAVSWSAVLLAVQIVLLLPLGAAVAVTFQAAAVLRPAPEGDGCASVCYDYGYAGALGAGAFAAVWAAGLSMLGVSMVLVVASSAGAAWLLGGRQGVVPPRRIEVPLERPAAWRQWAIAAQFACLAVIVLVQIRLVGDATAWGGVVRGGWLAVTLGAWAGLMAWTDKREPAEGQAQTSGAVIALVAAGMTQSALLAGAIVAQGEGRPALATTLLMLAAAGQPIFAGAAGCLSSRARRGYAIRGGRPGGYLAWSCWGLAAGTVVYLVLAEQTTGAVLLLSAAAAVLVGAVLAGAGRLEGAGRQWSWSLGGAVLIACLTAAVLPPMRRSADRIARGAWLTVWTADGAAAPPGLAALRGADAVRLKRLLRAALEQAGARGEWLVCGLERPPALGDDLSVVACAPDVSAVPAGPWRKRLRGLESDFLVALRARGRRYDGILITGLAADHPQAWRCYGTSTLSACRSRLHQGGRVIVRTHVSGERAGEALAVLASLRDVMGAGWAAAERTDSGVAVLAGSGAVPPGGAELGAVDLETLVDSLNVKAMGLAHFRAGGAWSLERLLELFP